MTGTPVYDPATGTVYLTSEEVPPGHPLDNPEFLMHAINAQTGAERPGWPVPIQGSPSDDPGRPFTPFRELERPGMLLLDGSVYAAFASHCDTTPFAGYVAGVNTRTRALSLWTDVTGPSYGEAGIWQSGGGLMSDGPGRIFLSTGNGTSPPAGPGSKPPGDLGDAVVQLSVQASGTLRAADFFSPANAPSLNVGDHDFGSGAPSACRSVAVFIRACWSRRARTAGSSCSTGTASAAVSRVPGGPTTWSAWPGPTAASGGTRPCSATPGR